MVHIRLSVLALLAVATYGRLTEEDCWQRNCLTRNDAGTLCFTPKANGAPAAACTDPVLADVLETHLHGGIGLSIAYYDQHARMLGSIMWPVPPQPRAFDVYVCMSGQRGDHPGFRTVCRRVERDNDVGDPSAHDRECAVEVGQIRVTDGCYFTAAAIPSADNLLHSTSFLDNPVLVHILFVLGGILTFGTFMAVMVRYRHHIGWVISHLGTKSARGARRVVGGVLSSLERRLPQPSEPSSTAVFIPIPEIRRPRPAQLEPLTPPSSVYSSPGGSDCGLCRAPVNQCSCPEIGIPAAVDFL